MKIQVKQKHIQEGCAHSDEYCPIACAIKESLMIPIPVHVSVRVSAIYINYYNKYHVPLSIKKFIKRFDGGEPVKPFSFILKRTQ